MPVVWWCACLWRHPPITFRRHSPGLMTNLEAEKASLGDNPMLNQGKELVTQFAMDVFQRADNEVV